MAKKNNSRRNNNKKSNRNKFKKASNKNKNVVSNLVDKGAIDSERVFLDDNFDKEGESFKKKNSKASLNNKNNSLNKKNKNSNRSKNSDLDKENKNKDKNNLDNKINNKDRKNNRDNKKNIDKGNNKDNEEKNNIDDDLSNKIDNIETKSISNEDIKDINTDNDNLDIDSDEKEEEILVKDQDIELDSNKDKDNTSDSDSDTDDDLSKLVSEIESDFKEIDNNTIIMPSFSSIYKTVDNIDIDENKNRVVRRHFKKKYIYLIVMILLLFIFSLFSYFFVPSIRLKGKSKVILNYKEKYKEAGFSSSIGFKNISKSVKVSGSVNSNKIGKYSIKYSVKKGIFSIKKTRTVIVKDIEGPNIKLKGGNKYYVCPGSKFVDPSYDVSDNYDKKVTNVKVKKKNNIYTYIAFDSSNNKSVVKREVIYKDVLKPVISFAGGNDLYISSSTKFSPLDGVSVVDNCDKDLIKKVKVVGNVFTDKPGLYELKYIVSDKSSNKSVLKRQVHVTKKDAPGTIYLTFDDGPHEGTTDVILDILKEENVKATFFVTNSGPDDLIVREYNEGHAIALHTSSHDYKYLYSSSDNYFNDLYSVQDRVYRLINKKVTTIRFPGGSSNTISRKYSPGIMSYLTQEVLKRGFRYYDWNLSSGDAGEVHTSEDVYNMVVSRLSHDRVNMILMHDIKTYTRDALRDIIRYAKDNGYTFDIIDDNTEMMMQKVNN